MMRSVISPLLLLRYTQTYDNHVVGRLDETEDRSKPPEIAESAPRLKKQHWREESSIWMRDLNVALFRLRE